MQEYLTHSEAETEQAGADFARALLDGNPSIDYGFTLREKNDEEK